MKYLLFLLTFILVNVTAVAQCKEELTPQKHAFKIKAVQGVSSSTARVADYVEFTTMESIYSVPVEGESKVLIAKGTPVFGIVTRRKHRHFPFVGGKLEVKLEPLINWDGAEISVRIARRGPIYELETKKETKERNKPCKSDGTNCVAGRRNASVAPIVPAIAAAGTAAIASVAGNTETRFIAGAALLTIAAQQGIGDLLNGTDAEISKDEIFDMFVKEASICAPLEDAKPTG